MFSLSASHMMLPNPCLYIPSICRTFGGNAKVLSGYPTIFQILVAEKASAEDRTNIFSHQMPRISRDYAWHGPHLAHGLLAILIIAFLRNI